MDTASMIRQFLDENGISAARTLEIVNKYHVELETGCRLTGCEIIMRAVDDDVFVRAELPISVMTKETRGVVKYLADLNKKRIEEGKQGYFDLDYVAGKIIFGIRVHQPASTEILRDVAHYCVEQIEYESDDLLKAVCDECEAVLQAEEERRLQLEKENREPSMFALLMRRLKKAIRNKLDPDAAAANARFGLPGAAPGEEPEFYDVGDPDEEPTAGESVQPDEKAEACEAADPLAQTLVDRLGLNDEADGQDAEAEEFEEPDETGRELPDQAFDRLFTEKAEEAAPAADEKNEESETAE